VIYLGSFDTSRLKVKIKRKKTNMTRLRQIKTTFTSGEISRRLLGRGDLAAYENGALSLRNVFIHPTGGVTRRSGLAYIDTVDGAGRLIDFEFNTQQTYLLVLTDLSMDIYQDGVKIETLVTPWSESQLSQMNWTQSADTLLICHPDIQPQKLTRSGAGVWSLSPWFFHTDDNGVNRQPMFKHAESAVTLNPSGSSGNITITASDNIFNPLHAGCFLSIGGKQVEVTSYASPTVVDASVIENLDSTNATTDWEEQAFSTLRGWPVSVCFIRIVWSLAGHVIYQTACGCQNRGIFGISIWAKGWMMNQLNFQFYRIRSMPSVRCFLAVIYKCLQAVPNGRLSGRL
jgi:hypothetical protein